MLILLAFKLVVQSVHRLLQEGHLDLGLLLDFVVLHHDLLVVVFDVRLELSEHTHLQLLVIVDVLGHPVNSVLEKSDVALILADSRISGTDGSLHIFLLESEVLNQESQAGVHLVELFQLTVTVIGFLLQRARLKLLGRDLFLQLLDSVIEDEFEFLKFLSLAL